MAARIEDYALIGNCETGALVARDGSIDWLCLPRFDSPACFAALLGTPEHGRWQIAPVTGEIRGVRRRYRPGTLVLETDYETDSGAVTVIDCMPIQTETPTLVRIVEGKRGLRLAGPVGAPHLRRHPGDRRRQRSPAPYADRPPRRALSSPRGESPTRASGRCVARAGRSRTPR